ncbi:MAG: dephospho-CoA kinase, partial [Planctomycetota bacterium]
MHIIGLTGGIASGKSLVADHLERLGAYVLRADQIGHEVLRMPEVMRLAVERWGAGVLDGEGQIDRAAVAKIVFAPPPEGVNERAYLEQITHPHITSSAEGQLRRLASEGCPIAVLDAALLVEAGWHKLCTLIVFVDAPREQRLGRARRRGWTAEEFAARESAQAELDAKRRLSEAVIDNSGPVDKTLGQVEHL